MTRGIEYKASEVGVRQASEKTLHRSSQGTYIAQSQAALVDDNKVVEVERINVDTLKNRTAYYAVKRSFDFLACSAALVVLSPLMAGIAVMVKLDSPGPAIYKQERLGKGGKPFTLYKFRSMRVEAEHDGAHWTSENDPRVTRLGTFLRNVRLDELPQFWNVVKGDMSLVGPRPERKVFYDKFEKSIHGFSQRLLVTPGISGLAQVSGGYDLKPAEKILYDIEYIKTQSLALDVRIILQTLGVVVSHDGAR